jgi:hypothetical protein
VKEKRCGVNGVTLALALSLSHFLIFSLLTHSSEVDADYYDRCYYLGLEGKVVV